MMLLHAVKVLAPSLVCVVWAILRVAGTPIAPLTVTGLLVLAAAFILAECERGRRK